MREVFYVDGADTRQRALVDFERRAIEALASAERRKLRRASFARRFTFVAVLLLVAFQVFVGNVAFGDSAHPNVPVGGFGAVIVFLLGAFVADVVGIGSNGSHAFLAVGNVGLACAALGLVFGVPTKSDFFQISLVSVFLSLVITPIVSAIGWFAETDRRRLLDAVDADLRRGLVLELDASPHAGRLDAVTLLPTSGAVVDRALEGSSDAWRRVVVTRVVIPGDDLVDIVLAPAPHDVAASSERRMTSAELEEVDQVAYKLLRFGLGLVVVWTFVSQSALSILEALFHWRDIGDLRLAVLIVVLVIRMPSVVTLRSALRRDRAAAVVRRESLASGDDGSSLVVETLPASGIVWTEDREPGPLRKAGLPWSSR